MFVSIPINLINSQLKKNTFWSILDLGIYPAMMVIATPVFIQYLGFEQYGIWMMVSTINQFIYVLNFGLGNTTIKVISANRALGNQTLIATVVNKNWSQALLICMVSAILGGIVSFSGILEFWFHVPINLISTTHIVACFAFISAGIKFCELVLLSIFKGYERFDIAAQLSLLSRNTVVIMNVALVILGYSLSMVFFSTVIINLLNILLQVLILKKHFPVLRFIPHFRIHLGFSNKEQFWYWLQSVIGLLGFLSDKIAVGYLSDLKTLGIYSLASLIGNQIYNALTAIGTFLFPKVAYEQSLNKTTLHIYYNFRLYIAILGWTIIFILLLSGDVVFKLWLGPDKFENSIFYINMYLVYIAVMLLNIIPYQFINGSDQLFYNSLFEGILRTAHVIAMMVCFYFFDIKGLLWGLISSTFLILAFQYYYFHKKFFEIHSVFSGLTVVLPSLSFIPFIIGASIWLKIAGCIFFPVSFYLFYYKPSLKTVADKSNQ